MLKKFVLLLFLFMLLAPLALSILIRSGWIDWPGPATHIHGELIEPTRPVGSFSLPDATGKVRDQSDFDGLWQLVYVDADGCPRQCLERLFGLRELRRSLDRDRPDVGLVLISLPALDAPRIDDILRLAPDLMVFDGSSGRALAARFPRPEPSAFYIVGPAGNIMMRFDGDVDPDGIRLELRRLLTWTRRD